MNKYLQSHFDEDVTKLFQQWKKNCKSHKNNTKSDSEKKQQNYIQNSIEKFCLNLSSFTVPLCKNLFHYVNIIT